MLHFTSVPKRALAIYFSLAFLGAALFIYLTFPVHPTKLSTSHNQPVPRSTTPPVSRVDENGRPIFVNIPSTPAAPTTGIVLHVLAWGQGNAPERIQQEINLFMHNTGTAATIVLNPTFTGFKNALAAAISAHQPPDVILLDATDYDSLGHADLLPLPVPANLSPAANILTGTLIRNGSLFAAPDEFSIDVLFYNPGFFDQVGIGYPGPHWTLDIMEGDSKALTFAKLLSPEGSRIFALETPSDFSLLNLLSTEAGAPILDSAGWHLGESKFAPAHIRALEFFQTYFKDLDVVVPMTNNETEPGDLFVKSRACLLIAPIETRARLSENSDLRFELTRFPQDLRPSTNLRVNGWAVLKSTQHPKEASALAQALCLLPAHDGWITAAPVASDAIPTEDRTVNAFALDQVPNALFAPIDGAAEQRIAAVNHQLQVYTQTADLTKAPTLYQIILQNQPNLGPVEVGTAPPIALPSAKPRPHP